MTTGIYNFTIEQGATFTRHFIWKDGEGNIVNLSGYVARMQIRHRKESDQILFEATTQNGKLVLTANEGKISLLISAAETSALKFESAVYDLEMESSSGIVTRLFEGTATLSKQVTR